MGAETDSESGNTEGEELSSEGGTRRIIETLNPTSPHENEIIKPESSTGVDRIIDPETKKVITKLAPQTPNAIGHLKVRHRHQL